MKIKLLQLLMLVFLSLIHCLVNVGASGQELFQPADDEIEYRSTTESTPFQLCLACKCCSTSNPTSCATMPCCFAIDCQLPNKPYGVCAFVPKSCSCTSCAV
ncbi:hypothetical protein K2173_000071 [Erythroxylum novogranatense]|uniref:DUF7866 domain-containing protein n=1 Tax=Erythroxylum novogranatense TaxID=1862640 RepID=A0AAV8SNC9_9ROSI|nr:hypothetical protein K2173_000071 [Erythroxylum novogranatense]